MKTNCYMVKSLQQENNIEMSLTNNMPMATNCMNRGVEAKAISNTCIDVESVAGSGSPSVTDQSSASYVQVVVQKQRRGPHHLTSTSSPDHAPPAEMSRAMVAGAGETGTDLVTLAARCPGLAALLQLQPPIARATATTDITPSTSAPGRSLKNTKCGVWRKLCDVASGKQAASSGVDGPARVAVFRLERGTALSVTRSWDPAGRGTRVERLARLVAAPAAVLLDEVLALLRLFFTLPMHILLRIGRCALSAGVWATGGALQAVGDEALTPAVALGYNVIARPPLVLVMHATMALRDALRPLWLTFADALQPLVHVLSSCRLVQLETSCRCSQIHPV